MALKVIVNDCLLPGESLGDLGYEAGHIGELKVERTGMATVPREDFEGLAVRLGGDHEGNEHALFLYACTQVIAILSGVAIEGEAEEIGLEPCGRDGDDAGVCLGFGGGFGSGGGEHEGIPVPGMCSRRRLVAGGLANLWDPV